MKKLFFAGVFFALCFAGCGEGTQSEDWSFWEGEEAPPRPNNEALDIKAVYGGGVLAVSFYPVKDAASYRAFLARKGEHGAILPLGGVTEAAPDADDAERLRMYLEVFAFGGFADAEGKLKSDDYDVGVLVNCDESRVYPAIVWETFTLGE